MHGSRATVRLRPLTPFRDENGVLVDHPLESPHKADAFALQMHILAAALTYQAAPTNSAEQAVYLMEMLDAIACPAPPAGKCRSLGPKK